MARRAVQEASRNAPLGTYLPVRLLETVSIACFVGPMISTFTDDVLLHFEGLLNANWTRYNSDALQTNVHLGIGPGQRRCACCTRTSL